MAKMASAEAIRSWCRRFPAWCSRLSRVSIYTLAIVVLAVGQVIGYGMLQSNTRADRQRDIDNRITLCEQRNLEDERRSARSDVTRQFYSLLVRDLRADGAYHSAERLEAALEEMRAVPPAKPIDCNLLRR